MGKGGGGGPTQTTSTVQNTNVPEYARPYVETMLGATQQQLFQGSRGPSTTDPNTGQTVQGDFNITGFKPYQAYGGTYDSQGNQTSYDPSKAISGFQPMQETAQRNIGNMDARTQDYNYGQQQAINAGIGAGQSAQQALGYGAMGQQAGMQGQRSGMMGQRYGMQAGNNAAMQSNAQMGLANQYGMAGYGAGQTGQNLGIMGGANYGGQGAAMGQQASGLAGDAMGYGRGSANIGQQAANLSGSAMNYGGMGANYGGQGAAMGRQAAGLAGNAMGYGNVGMGYGQQASQLAGNALGYGQNAADIGQMGLRAQGMGENIAGQSQGLAQQQAMAGQQYAQQATNPNATQAYMSPYMQNVVNVQNQEAMRNAKIAGTQQQAEATRAGAFGGSRDAIMRAERERNLSTLMNQNQAQGLQSAYQQAQQAQQFGANLGLQGMAGAQQGLGTALQGGQLGLSGIGTALQGQQGAMSGVGQAGAMYGLGMQGAGMGMQGINAANQAYQTGMQGTAQGMQGAGMGLQGVNAANQAYQTGLQGQQGALQGVSAANQAYQTGIQGAGMGLQGVNAQLAGTAQGMQGAQSGLAGVGAATNAGQYGLQGAQVGLQGTAQGMQGAGMGMQGAQSGLAGVQGAQAGYGLQGQQAMNYANMLGQQQQNQLGLYGAQNTVGAQQQALEQAKINQAMQDYANAQQYPLMQLGTMSNMLRGLPMQASTTNQYQAAPNQVSQAIGAIGSGASIYNAMKPGGAAGGLPSEFKYSKGGGIMSYDMGGEVEAQLENMDEKGLQTQARESSSPSIRRMAQRILRERQMGEQPKGTGPMGVQYQASATPGMRNGGIIAFAKGDTVYGGPSSEAKEGEEDARVGMEKRLAMPPATGGILGAGPVTAAPTTPVPTAPAKPSPFIDKEAIAQRDLYTAQANRPTEEVVKEIQADRRALGVDTSEARDKYRSEQMAERANMKDEQERQRHMRLAEFFASWGSTPGPTLVAGMNALKQSIPGIITDEKEAKKARKEADKIIYDIDEATRLEKLGLYDKATALKEKAAGRAEDYNKYLLNLQAQREGNERAIEAANIQAASSKYVADTQAKSQSAATSQRGQEVMFANVDRALQGALRRQAEIEKDIETTISKPPKGTPLAKAIETVNRFNSILADKKGDISKMSAYQIKEAELQQEIIDGFKTRSDQRLQAAKNEVKRYEDIFSSQGRGAKSGSNDKPQAGASTRPSLTDPSLQK